ncbi:hypothetical protein HY522_02860 [bacterium]|nr:hypothetical protein [bacterium]
MKVIKSEIGLCVGIVNAYDKMNRAAQKEGPFLAAHQNSGGDWDTLKRIERKDPNIMERYPNLRNVTVVHDPAQLKPGDRLVLGFHGFPAETKSELKEKGVNLLKDFQCPFIATMDRQAEGLARDGFDLLVMGNKGSHHCTEAERLAAKHGRSCTVLEKAEDADGIAVREGQKLALIGQVTGNTETWSKVVDRVRQRQLPVKIVETVCSDSYDRQAAARRVAMESDVVILINDGGDGSRSSFEVASAVHARIHRISRKEDIQPAWLEHAETVGVIGGITVPQWSIDEVAKYVDEISPSVAPA